MNLHPLTEPESRYLLFAFKRALRDPEGLTPEMKQFYTSQVATLQEKLLRIDNVKHSSSYICDV